MNSIRISSILLFLAVAGIAVFLGGKEINSQIEKTVHEHYRTEIDALKEKLNKQSELINSILNLKNDDSTDDPDTNGENTNDDETDTDVDTNGSVITENMFEYKIEGGGVTVTRYTGNATTVRIPERIDGYPVLKIGENAFSETRVKSVTVPTTCTEIDWFAFYGCYALKSVHISGSVQSIGYGAFDSCPKSITIYCEQDSYTQKYAESFGLSYSIYK